jgi:hypothetical protein
MIVFHRHFLLLQLADIFIYFYTGNVPGTAQLDETIFVNKYDKSLEINADYFSENDRPCFLSLQPLPALGLSR